MPPVAVAAVHGQQGLLWHRSVAGYLPAPPCNRTVQWPLLMPEAVYT
jgi:hypothetical protein